MSNLETILERWSAPLTQTQTEKCERAVREIKAAVGAHAFLGKQLSNGVVEVLSKALMPTTSTSEMRAMLMCVYSTRVPTFASPRRT